MHGSANCSNEQVLRVGVIGCGLVAQVMHLRFLADLSDRFVVAMLCDIATSATQRAQKWAPTAKVTKRWEDVIDSGVDAVLVLTPGSHAPVIEAAAAVGIHVFAEKPMAVSAHEAVDAAQAARAAGIVLQIGYMKRYDPAWEALRDDELPRLGRPQLVRTTTLEAPLGPYVSHLGIVPSSDADPAELEQLLADDDLRVRDAIGSQMDDPTLKRAYRMVLLDCMIHELNLLRATLGEPDVLRYAHISPGAKNVTLEMGFGETDCVSLWTELDDLGRYEQELAFYSGHHRASLKFPSPFLAHAPTMLVTEGGEAGSVDTWRRERVAGYDEAFRRELVHFHECVTNGDTPRSDGWDGVRDLLLAEAVIECVTTGRPVKSPTSHPTAPLPTEVP